VSTFFPAGFLLELEDELLEELDAELVVDLLLTLELALVDVSHPLLSAALSFLASLVLLFPELAVPLELLDAPRSSASFVLYLFPASWLRPFRLRLS
jgi:hypothetical protein